MGGVADLPIRLHGSKVIKKMKKHGFSASELRDLPQAVANPIAVFDNLGRTGNRSVLTELKTQNGNFLVTIDLGNGSEADFDIVSSVFGKNNKSVLGWLNSGKLRYVDKKKALNYLHLSAPIAEASENSELSSAAKVVDKFGNPTKIPEKTPMEEASAEDEVLFRDGDPEEHGRGLARERYERRVRTGWFQTREALQDSMAGLEEGMTSILKGTGEWKKGMHIEDVPDYENPYIGENRLSSVNQDEANEMAKKYFKPLYGEVKTLAKNAEERAALTDYMMAKHGLERNEVMAARAADKDWKKYQKSTSLEVPPPARCETRGGNPGRTVGSTRRHAFFTAYVFHEWLILIVLFFRRRRS